MKKKNLLLIALLVVIISASYGVKADTCTYDLNTPSKEFNAMCMKVCDTSYKNPKSGDSDYNDDTKNRNAACNSWCYSYKASDVDRQCYCLKQHQSGAGDECYKAALLGAMEKEKWGKKTTTVSNELDKANKTAAMETACKAIAGCSAGDTTAETQAYNNTLSNCKAKSVTCDTATVCANKLCDSSYSGNKYCTSGLDPVSYCNKKTSSGKNTSYSYGAGNNGTKGSISEDLDYISKITVKNCYGFGEIVYYTSLVIKIIQLAAPVILIIWASLDLFKSVMAGDEKKIVEMRKPIIQRFISAAAIFLVPWLVSTIVDNFSSNADWLVCWKNNRYNYSRGSEDYNGSGYVNPVHDQSKEKNYIKYSCNEVCNGKSITKCTEQCMNMYWESQINCYPSKPENVQNPTSSQIEDARVHCYDEFAKNTYEILKNKK